MPALLSHKNFPHLRVPLCFQLRHSLPRQPVSRKPPLRLERLARAFNRKPSQRIIRRFHRHVEAARRHYKRNATRPHLRGRSSQGLPLALPLPGKGRATNRRIQRKKRRQTLHRPIHCLFQRRRLLCIQPPAHHSQAHQRFNHVAPSACGPIANAFNSSKPAISSQETVTSRDVSASARARAALQPRKPSCPRHPPPVSAITAGLLCCA
jgi:hypothetical protein